jgi:SSS family solute:Na+ symporter/sodium/proline symporter
VVKAGGVSGVLSSLPEEQRHLFGHYSPTHLLSVLLPSLLLIIGDANMYQRFFSARDPGSAQRSAAWMFVGVLLLECGIIATALVAKSLVIQGKMSAPEITGHIVVQAAFQALPGVLGALLVATVVAVVVSTADSYLLAPSTSLVRDVYERFISKESSGRRIVTLGRFVVVLLGLVALLLSFTSDRFFGVALFAYTIYGAGITPVLLAAFFWRRATRPGAVASMITGVVTAIAWKGLVSTGVLARWADGAGLHTISQWMRNLAEARVEAILPSLVLSLLVLVVVSLSTRPPRLEEVRSF